MEKAIFAAGCFWGVEAAFRNKPGIVSTQVGYSGGTMQDPTYQDVCTGQTGHAEVVEVTYDPSLTTYDALLDIFWDCHNPTQLNQQGPDIGTQYRSAIFFLTPVQQFSAESSKEARQQSNMLDREIMTEITPASIFYPAEDYHQQYLEKRGCDSCH
jgi:peptide-methionine (S)-S-oxide reductase